MNRLPPSMSCFQKSFAVGRSASLRQLVLQYLEGPLELSSGLKNRNIRALQILRWRSQVVQLIHDIFDSSSALLQFICTGRTPGREGVDNGLVQLDHLIHQELQLIPIPIGCRCP